MSEEKHVPEHIKNLAEEGRAIADAYTSGGTRGLNKTEWRDRIDKWLLELGGNVQSDQVRVIAQMRSGGEPGERGIAPLRDAALAQIHTQQADRLAMAATSLSKVGIGVAVVGGLLAVVQVGIANGWL